MKVISFCLYGTHSLYIDGMRENIRLAPSVYEGWQVRVYTDLKSLELFEEFRQPHVKVVRMNPFDGHSGMFARFLAADDPDVDVVIFRDADSRINKREVAAVNSWLASGKQFHVMRDHPDHAQWPILGGMWGCRGGALRGITKLIAAWPHHSDKLDDMRFLTEKVWPHAKNNMKHHSSVATPHHGAEPFPTCLSEIDGTYKGYVGEIIQP